MSKLDEFARDMDCQLRSAKRKVWGEEGRLQDALTAVEKLLLHREVILIIGMNNGTPVRPVDILKKLLGEEYYPCKKKYDRFWTFLVVFQNTEHKIRLVLYRGWVLNSDYSSSNGSLR